MSFLFADGAPFLRTFSHAMPRLLAETTYAREFTLDARIRALGLVVARLTAIIALARVVRLIGAVTREMTIFVAATNQSAKLLDPIPDKMNLHATAIVMSATSMLAHVLRREPLEGARLVRSTTAKVTRLPAIATSRVVRFPAVSSITCSPLLSIQIQKRQGSNIPVASCSHSTMTDSFQREEIRLSTCKREDCTCPKVNEVSRMNGIEQEQIREVRLVERNHERRCSSQ